MATIRITADDFGVHDNIDRGIIACAKNGTINNIDTMVTLNDSKARIRDLMRKFKPEFRSGKLSLGLHLSLSCGSPLYHVHEEYLNAIAKLDKIKKTNQERYFFKYSGGAGLEMIENIEKLTAGYLPQLVEEMNAQYVEFKQITHDVIPDYEPSQISSHLGVYIANDDIYEASREFCKEMNLAMRCPTLMKYDPDYGPLWKTPKQKFLPAELIEFFAGKEGKKILEWVKNGQFKAFRQDQQDGLRSTDYFVEYFFRNGAFESLREIVERMKIMGDYSYEMVVHPVYAKSKAGLPGGISRLNFGDRVAEYETLKSKAAKENLVPIIHPAG